MSDDAMNALIDEYVARTRSLNGRQICERPQWNTVASADAIRHFAHGTSDDNPLWLDDEYARGTRHGRLQAPPAFLCSVLYPFLHGAPMAVPLSFLIGEVAFEWFRTVPEGERLSATARQIDVSEAIDRHGRRLVYVVAETAYRAAGNVAVATALGTMVGVARCKGEQLLDRDVHRYDASELDAIRVAIGEETRTGGERLTFQDIEIGRSLPLRVCAPLTVGDLIGWQSAIGPSYRAGKLGYRDTLESPHTATINPLTGWPVTYSQQHEDFLLAAQRGMPAPFDNSLMRFAWIVPMLTDWMGNDGFLKRLKIQTGAPMIYGDTTWYRGFISDQRAAPDGTSVEVTIRLTGVNQLGQTTTTGTAEIRLPAPSPGKSFPDRGAYTLAHAGTIDRPGEPSALDLFEARVDARPGATAVIVGDDVLTYADLDGCANRLARHLLASGVEAGDLVGVLTDRTAGTVIALLAILKAGAGYLPLDALQPLARLAHIVHHAAPSLLLVQHDLLLKFASLGRRGNEDVTGEARSGLAPPPRLLGIDAKGAAAGAGNGERLPRVNRLEHLAYAMSTSGSLRAPRVVGVSQASLARYLRAMYASLGVRPDDVCLHTASFSFSASVRQLFVPLTMGARLVIASPEQQSDPGALLRLIKERHITVWDTVPSIWRYCIDAVLALTGDARVDLLANDLRLILVTGETLPWAFPFAWRNTLRHTARVLNLYSQTETVGTVSIYRVPEEVTLQEGNVPLGRPVANTEVLLLDDALRPVAAGEVGEIHVLGPRLAEGYLGQEALTAERFVRSPLARRMGERLYKTGDLGRLLPDGIFVFVGRADHRVKIRGQRFELEEVEAAIKRHPKVRDAAVVGRTDQYDETRLLAYFVASSDDIPSAEDLRTHLRLLLPDAAIPATFAAMAVLPRTASGKLDRRALPEPEPRSSGSTGDDEMPRTPVERELAAIWAAVLGVGHIGVNDSFFDLGGHSLNASQVIGRVSQRLGVTLSLHAFFDAPTLSSCAAVIQRLGHGAADIEGNPRLSDGTLGGLTKR